MWKALMVTVSNFAWLSVTVKRSSTVLKGRSIVKCNWSDNFATLLEKAGSEFSTEVVIQVIISKNERLDTSHTVPLDAPVKLLETYGCLYVCYYLADNTVWEPAQGVEMPWLYWCESRLTLPPVCQNPSSGTEQFRGDQALRNDVTGYLQESFSWCLDLSCMFAHVATAVFISCVWHAINF